MKILIIGTKLTPQTNRLLQAASKRNLEATFCPRSKILITYTDEFNIYFNNVEFQNYDIFIFRDLGDQVDELTTIAYYLYSKNKTIIDEKLATRKYTADKTLTFTLCGLHNLPYPKTIHIFNKDDIVKIKQELNPPYIIKETISSRGAGVHLAKNFNELQTFISKATNFKFFIQEKLGTKAEDYRVFIVGKKVVGIMKKTALDGEFRSNVALGGKTQKISNSNELAALGLKAAEITNTEIAGVDIMYSNDGKPYILEVNRSPQFEEISKICGVDIANEIIKYAIKKFNQQQ